MNPFAFGSLQVPLYRGIVYPLYSITIEYPGEDIKSLVS